MAELIVKIFKQSVSAKGLSNAQCHKKRKRKEIEELPNISKIFPAQKSLPIL